MRKAALALVAIASLAACGAGAGDLTVFAAASLSTALPQHDGVRYSFAGSQQLVAQIEQGADADVLVTADERTIKRVAADYKAIASTTLAIAVAPGNPKRISSLHDLAGATIAVVLADPSVPIGRYSADALAKANVAIQPKSLELDVEAALQKVVIREADATIAYAVAEAEAELIPIPPEHNVAARYYAAALTGRGQAYVDELPAVLHKHGFDDP